MINEEAIRHLQAARLMLLGKDNQPISDLYYAIDAGIEALEQTQWIPVSERLPQKDGDYLVTYEKGYAEDYDLGNIGIAGFEVDCESFGYWYEQFNRHTLGSLGSEWEKIEVIAWMPLPKPYEPQERGE